MKILEPAADAATWSMTCECTGKGNSGRGCGATLLISADDVYTTFQTGRLSTKTYKTIRCCHCGAETDLENVPESIGNNTKSNWIMRQQLSE